MYIYVFIYKRIYVYYMSTFNNNTYVLFYGLQGASQRRQIATHLPTGSGTYARHHRTAHRVGGYRRRGTHSHLSIYILWVKGALDA